MISAFRRGYILDPVVKDLLKKRSSVEVVIQWFDCARRADRFKNGIEALKAKVSWHMGQETF